jgi:hypothetical protein
LIACNLAEAEAEEKFCDGGACILVGGVEYAGSESGLMEVLDRLRSHFALKAGIDGDEKTGPAFIHVSPGVVESDSENLRGRQMNANGVV